MTEKQKHIILLGFKNVGKSTVGKLLAEKLQWPFIDLDQRIEQNYKNQRQQSCSCREIYQQHGEQFFSVCETQALREVIDGPKAVIALGGGAPLKEENKALIKFHWLVYITATPAVVYERILSKGKPAYFPSEEDPAEFFQRLWHQREKIYENLSNLTVDNTDDVKKTVEEILKNWEMKE